MNIQLALIFFEWKLIWGEEEYQEELIMCN